MGKSFKIFIFILLFVIVALVYLFSYRNDTRQARRRASVADSRHPKAQIAIIFDDLGESLQELEWIHSLDIPVSIAIVPGLRFSNNIARIGSGCGYPVLIHMPLEPIDSDNFKTKKYVFISEDLGDSEINSLLKRYLEFSEVAIGVNNHMGSRACQSIALMRKVMRAIKKRNLFFIDSRTSTNSVAYDIAKEEGVLCSYNEGFIDPLGGEVTMGEQFDGLISAAKNKGKIIAIAHPKEETLAFLKDRVKLAAQEVEFITLREYFNLDDVRRQGR